MTYYQSVYKPCCDWHLATLFFVVISARSETIVNGRPSVVVESRVAAVVYDLGGGSLVRFQLQDRALTRSRGHGLAREYLRVIRWGIFCASTVGARLRTLKVKTACRSTARLDG